MSFQDIRRRTFRKPPENFYFYEHANGSIIMKVGHVVTTGTSPLEYFDSPFVLRWWRGDDWPSNLRNPFEEDTHEQEDTPVPASDSSDPEL